MTDNRFAHGILLGVFIASFFWIVVCIEQSKGAARLCRHTIQRSFAKSSDEAHRLMKETEAWEEN